MSVIVYDPTKYEVAPGTYLCKFLGAKDREPFDGPGKFGRVNNEPRLGWQFQIVGPTGNAMLGKVIEQGTGTTPSRKSGLVRLLNLMLGGIGLQPGQAIDPASFVGKTYQIQWSENPSSEKGNCWIASMMEVFGSQAQPQTPTAAAPTSGSEPRVHTTGTLTNKGGPPPRKPAAPAPTPAPDPLIGKKYWVERTAGQDPVLMQDYEIKPWLNVQGRSSEEIPAILDGEDEWRTLAYYGYQPEIPF